MSLQIIGAGFGRTGTMSTYTALNALGFPSYHMAEVILNKENKTRHQYQPYWSVIYSKEANLVSIYLIKTWTYINVSQCNTG